MNVVEKDLLDSIKQGNEKSFELLFKEWYGKLCVFAMGYTRQKETAEDIVKDFFIQLWINREKLNIRNSLSGYLFRSVQNSCINYLEREKYLSKTKSLEELNWLNLKISEPFSDDYVSGILFAKELDNQISCEIEKLPDACREIFKLSRFEGLSHKAISSKLNISENTIKVQIYRALKKLRAVLQSNTIILFRLFIK